MIRRIAIAFTTALVIVLTTAAFASGASKAVRDPAGDAAPRADITSASIYNGAHRIGTRAKIPDLQRRGTFILFFRKSTWFDFGLELKVHIAADGTMRTGLYYSGDGGDQRQPCSDVRASWKVATGIIKVSAPQRCLAKHGRWIMSAFTPLGRHSDATRQVGVNQG